MGPMGSESPLFAGIPGAEVTRSDGAASLLEQCLMGWLFFFLALLYCFRQRFEQAIMKFLDWQLDDYLLLSVLAKTSNLTIS
jgi:hypothetical protein